MSAYVLTFLLCLFFSPNLFAQIDLGLDVDVASSVDEVEDEQPVNSDDKKSFFSKAFDFLGSEGGMQSSKGFLTLEELKASAEQGDIEAILDLGYRHLYGVNGVKIDYKQAFYYYNLASEKNNPVALNNMGSLYFNGIGVEADYDKAIDYFKKAIKQGSSDAALNLAVIYLGSNTKHKKQEDLEYSFDLLNQAAKSSNIYAQYLLGYAHYIGFIVDQNYQKAFSYIKKAADNQYDEAQFMLAHFYIEGKGVTRNYTNAVIYLKQASNQGHKDAIIKLADIYSEGVIYTRNIKEAHILYNIASVIGSKYAEQRRDELEKKLKIEDLLEVQLNAEKMKLTPSSQTTFARKTFGNSLKAYIDMNIKNNKIMN